MKRLLVVALMLLVGVVALPTSASAQLDLSKIGGMLRRSSSKSSTTTTKTSPYKALAENAPAKSEILGVWSYSDIDIVYLGTNSFAEAALAQVKSVVRQELRMQGVTPGCFAITLLKSGKGSFSYGDYVFEGSYTYDSSKARFELTATADNGKAIKCGGFLKKVDGKLVVMLDAQDALDAIATVIPEISAGDAQTFDSINGIVQSFPGIYISMYYTK